CLQGYCSPSSF
nr:immunoglobulin light chain junction region [Macaca mulatta]